MPDGKTHAIGTGMIASGTVAAGLYFMLPADVVGMIVIGELATLIINPDLDQAEARKGCLAALFWPYGKLIPHRSWLSHFPVVGTFIRVGYIYGLWFLAAYLAKVHFGVLVNVQMLSFWLFAGMALSDTFHAVLDVADSRLKT